MKEVISVQNPVFDIKKVVHALESTPTAAYTAPHDYPHGAPMFQPAEMMEREKIEHDSFRLYSHIPFCNYHCSYCCYAKRVGIDDTTMKRYVRALKQEMQEVEEGKPLSQLFMGGGTPTALPADQLDDLLSYINHRFPSNGTGVHTVETSPESMTDEHIKVLKRNGIGRISMGIQSLQENVLNNVTRHHTQDTALDTCTKVIDNGFIMNIDLIYGLPGQTEEDFFRDFEMVASRGVHAVTAYNLRINEMTAVQRKLSKEETFSINNLMRWRMFVRETARSFGYTQTRWHTFKKLDTVAAKHTRLPTSGHDFKGYQLGIGMSARSSIGHQVYRNTKKLDGYMLRAEQFQSPVDEVIHLNREDIKTMFIARTLGDGHNLNFSEYEEVFKTSFMSDFNLVVERLRYAELISISDQEIALTVNGKNIYDLIMLSFYPENAKQWLLEKMPNYQLSVEAV